MIAARYGALFYGQFESPHSDAIIENLYRLVGELNGQTRFVTLGLANSGNTLSAENVLTWNCGFPAAVTHQNGKPAYFGCENTAPNLLEQNKCDVCRMIIGTRVVVS